MEIKNKLTVTRGQGTTGESRGMVIKEQVLKATVKARIECGRWVWVGQGE